MLYPDLGCTNPTMNPLHAVPLAVLHQLLPVESTNRLTREGVVLLTSLPQGRVIVAQRELCHL